MSEVGSRQPACDPLRTGRSGIELAAGTTSAWAGTEPVAYAVTRTRELADPVHEMTVDIAVHPAHRTPSAIAHLLARCRRTAAAPAPRGVR